MGHLKDLKGVPQIPYRTLLKFVSARSAKSLEKLVNNPVILLFFIEAMKKFCDKEKFA
jgi:hypothetical protein